VCSSDLSNNVTAFGPPQPGDPVISSSMSISINGDSTPSKTVLTNSTPFSIVYINCTVNGAYYQTGYVQQLPGIYVNLYNESSLNNFTSFVAQTGYTISDDNPSGSDGSIHFVITFTSAFIVAHAYQSLNLVLITDNLGDSIISPVEIIYFMHPTPNFIDNTHPSPSYFGLPPIGMFIFWFAIIFIPYIIALTYGLGIKLAYVISIFDISILFILGYLFIWIWGLLLVLFVEMILIGRDD
jgi:hypothetical protein